MVGAQRAVLPHESLIMAVSSIRRARLQQRRAQCVQLAESKLEGSAQGGAVTDEFLARPRSSLLGIKVMRVCISHLSCDEGLDQGVVGIGGHGQTLRERERVDYLALKSSVVNAAELRNKAVKYRERIIGQREHNSNRLAVRDPYNRISNLCLYVHERGFDFSQQATKHSLLFLTLVDRFTTTLLLCLVGADEYSRNNGSDGSHGLHPRRPIEFTLHRGEDDPGNREEQRRYGGQRIQVPKPTKVCLFFCHQRSIA